MRALTYNVLATRYIRRHYYPRVEDRHLDPSWRHQALVDAVGALGADVICLQEVEREVFDALERRLGERFASALAMKGGGRPDGAALLARRDAVELVDHAVLAYDDDSGHIAQIARVELAGAVLGVANTHLRWDPAERARADKIGVRQVEQLLSERDAIAPGCDGWLVCGDLNAGPRSDVAQTLEAAGLRCVHRDSGALTCNANGRARLIDHLFVSDSLDAAPIMPPVIADDTPLPSDAHPSDHLPLAAELSWR